MMETDYKKTKTLILFAQKQWKFLKMELKLPEKPRCKFCDKRIFSTNVGHIIKKDIILCEEQLCMASGVVNGYFHKTKKTEPK